MHLLDEAVAVFREATDKIGMWGTKRAEVVARSVEGGSRSRADFKRRYGHERARARIGVDKVGSAPRPRKSARSQANNDPINQWRMAHDWERGLKTKGTKAKEMPGKPGKKMVFGKWQRAEDVSASALRGIQALDEAKLSKLSKIIKDVNKANAPPGGWSAADKVAPAPKKAALSGKSRIDTSHPKMKGLIAKLRADPKVKDPEALAAYIARRAAASKGGPKTSKTESVGASALRVLSEAALKVGDYVTTKDGRRGYIERVAGGKVYFTHNTNKSAELVVCGVDQVNVNPGGPPR